MQDFTESCIYYVKKRSNTLQSATRTLAALLADYA